MKTQVTALILIALASSLTSCSSEQQTPAEQVFEKVDNSVVKVYSLLEQGEPGRSGSGFAVQFENQPVQILTNKHLTENASVIVIESATDIWVVERWAEHPSLDAALLDMPNTQPIQAIQIGTASQARPGQEIFVVGYPLGDSISIQAGHISALGMGDLVFNAPFSQGASGSPLLDKKGRAIGLCHSYMKEAQNHNMATPLDLLSTPSTWDIKTSSPDQEVLAYLKKISTVKKALQRNLEQWSNIAKDMPEWYIWVGKSMLTRKPLSEAFEDLYLAVHSVQWGEVFNPASRTSTKLEAVLLKQNVQKMFASWKAHQQNLLHLSDSRPQQILDFDTDQFQQYVDSSSALSEQLGLFLTKSADTPPEDIQALTSALQQYLEHEKACLALGLP